MDLQWLPGIEISTRGKVSKVDDKECSFLATTSGDGKVCMCGLVGLCGRLCAWADWVWVWLCVCVLECF